MTDNFPRVTAILSRIPDALIAALAWAAEHRPDDLRRAIEVCDAHL